jgi:hypothetical protein
MAVLVVVTVGAGALGPTLARARTQPEEQRSVTKTVTAVGTVKAVSAGRVVVIGKARGRAAEWTFAVDAKTRITKGGKEITAAVLRPGDRVNVRYAEQAGRTIALDITVTGRARKALKKRP